MKTYLYYLLALLALLATLAISILSHLIWPSIALGIILLWVCVSLYGRIDRLFYAYRETEKENEKLHTRLAESERQLQYLRQLTENVDTALFVCSTDGRIDWMNHAARQAYPQPLPKGREFLPVSVLQAITDYDEVVDGCALSTVLLRIDGKQRLVVALKDVSALMQRQEMEAWQQLIRVLTHEIMNSLTPIISISETMSNPLPTSQRGGESSAFEVINRRCHSLLDFVESYRQLTRIKAPERTTFPISELFEDLKALFSPLLISPQGGEGYLYADRSQIEQVLINLIKNSYESGATEVEVTARSEGVICVQDNGCGMSPDVLEHAFIPFFTTKPTGTGIGLALCRQIILKHGGTISVESVPDKGTTITLNIATSFSPLARDPFGVEH
jgi:signal transduction histidine kinase